jgi:hypothetical protein
VDWIFYVLCFIWNHLGQFILSFLFVCSIKHEYGAWDDKNPTVQTCNANIKITPGSHTPQEVSPDAYVVFSYDVTFEV